MESLIGNFYSNKKYEICNLLTYQSLYVLNKCNVFDISFSGSFCFLKNKFELYFVLSFLKVYYSFLQLIDLTSIDLLKSDYRFFVFYNLLSLKLNRRLFLIVKLKEFDSIISITNLFSSAMWAERECWDMFGIYFSDNLDLRRILTDYGFEYFPLRKDFPLMGFLEVRYDMERKTLVYEPVELSQEFREFEFKMPWKVLENHINYK